MFSCHFGRRGFRDWQAVRLEFFDVEPDCLANQGSDLLAGLRSGDTAGEFRDMGSVAGGPLFDERTELRYRSGSVRMSGRVGRSVGSVSGWVAIGAPDRRLSLRTVFHISSCRLRRYSFCISRYSI